jgi:cytochrome c oxidase subunit II
MPAAVRRPLALAVLCSLVVTGIASAGNGGIAPLDGESPNADRIVDAYWWIVLFTGAIFVLVQGTLIWFLIRYRRRGRSRDEAGPQVHGNVGLELAWTVAPVLILVAIGSFIFYKLPGIENVPSANAAGGRTEVVAKGYRFYWQYEYANGVIAVDRLRAPLDRTVKVDVTAPDFEVIHSWWVPPLGGKFDAIPGMVNETWFRAQHAGIYRGQCAEFCGIEHAAMTTDVEVLPQQEFDDWLESEAQAQAAGTSKLGESTFKGACGKCHGLAGDGDIGPRLAGNPIVTDEKAVEFIVRNGRNQMPPVGKDWGDRQLKALTDYLKQELANGS